MKQLLLLPLIAILSMSATYAPQEPSKAETIAWLNKYGSQMYKNCRMILSSSTLDASMLIDTTSDLLETYYAYVNGDDDEIIQTCKIKISEINKLMISNSENSNKAIYNVYLFGPKDFMTETFSLTGRKSFFSLMTLKFNTEDDAQRVFNAIKHLISFYDNEVEFINETDLENKF
ncbi:MAG: hypothetical protein JXQ87_08415 [Bacteroidia bacterium]